MAARFTFQAIGTSWDIRIPHVADGVVASRIERAIRDRIDRFDRAYSRFRTDSLVADIARTAGEYQLPEDADAMIRLYRELYEATGGKVTPLIGQVLVDAGYDPAYTLKPRERIEPAPKWDDVMEYRLSGGRPILATRAPALLDFGALGKGYLVDLVAETIRENGEQEYAINAGGDIRVSAEPSRPMRVGLEDPQDFRKAVGFAAISHGSICGSAGNRRVWDRFHHIIDPDTVESPRHILGLWTVADTALVADAMATALFFAEPAALARRFKFEYAILYAGRAPVMSSGFPGEFF